MKKINFTLQIGGKTPSAVNAVVKIYGISAKDQFEINTLNMSKANETYDIPEHIFDYCYATCNISSFTINNQSYVVPENQEVEFLAVFESNETEIVFNERLTIANAYCFTQSMVIVDHGGVTFKSTDRILGLSLGMRRNFISTDGVVSTVIESSPNGLQTNSFPLWNSLGNLLYSASIDPNVYSQFTHLVSDEGDSKTFLAALFYITREPFTAVSDIYTLITTLSPVFEPSLTELNLPQGHKAQPDQWTLTIKIHDSGAQNYLIAGPAFVTFDKNDRGWTTNNVVQGTPNSAPYCMVFEPDGKPAAFSPVFGGGLVGAGFGVVPDKTGENIYFGSFGWGPTQCNPQHGAIAQFSADGKTLSPSNGYTEGLSRVQGLNFDGEGNLWVTSWGSQAPFAPADTIYPFEGEESAVVVFLLDTETNELDFSNPLIYPLGNMYRATFDVVYNPVANAMYLSCGGTENKGDSSKSGISGVYKFILENGAIVCKAQWDTDPSNVPLSTNVEDFEGLKQVSIDSKGFVYVGAIQTGASRIVKLDQELNYVSEITDNINRPWSVTIDKSDTIFAGNFGLEFEPMPRIKDLPVGSTGVTVFRKEGDDYTSGQLMTLPTGGDEVVLANGFPLYGIVKEVEEYNAEGQAVDTPIVPPCYTPLMRITSSSIDGAGNLWVINNWKPSAANDILLNPGGDGIVIFVGVASPEPYKFG